MIIGYARVSTLDQDLGNQEKTLKERGCERIYSEKISGGKRDRPELDKMLRELKRGDVVLVQKLDRLGRSLSHLMEMVNFFKEQGIGFRVLDGSMDTTTPQGSLVFHIMGAIAEFERGLISERTKDALAYKKSIGVKLGRRFVVDREKMGVLEGLKKEGKGRLEIMGEMGITHYKYYQLVNRSGGDPSLEKSANHV